MKQVSGMVAAVLKPTTIKVITLWYVVQKIYSVSLRSSV